jgi:hypothetical protein
MSKTTETAANLSPIQTELLRRADSIFDSVAQTVNQAKDFAAEQIPDIALQYVSWGRGYLTAYMVIATILLIVGIYWLIRISILNSRNLPNDRYHEPHTVRILSGLGGGIMICASTITILINLKEFMMVWFAPKVWLITEIVKLVKQ